MSEATETLRMFLALFFLLGCLQRCLTCPVAFNPVQVIDRLLKNDPWHARCLHEPLSFLEYLRNMGRCDSVDRQALLEDDGRRSAFRFVKTPRAGIATFANRKIKRGELVHLERPLLQYVPNTPGESYLQALDSYEKEILFSLHDSSVQDPGEPKSFMGILNTNLFQTGTISGIFPQLTRLNHACRPNIHYNWDNLRNLMTVHAQDDIEEGEEIYDSYIYFATDTHTRMTSLRNSYKFECKCKLCSRKNRAQVELSDQRRSRIDPLRKEAQELETKDPHLALKKLEEVLEIYRQEDLMYYGQYPGSANEMYLKILINFPIHERNVKLISDFARYTLGNYTIAFGKEFVDRELHWIKSYL